MTRTGPGTRDGRTSARSAHQNAGDTDVVVLDPHDAGTQQDPFAVYAHLRRDHPVLVMPDGTAVVSRHADIVELLKGGGVSSAQEAGAAGAPVAALAEHSRSVMIASDPPVHTRRREAVAPSLAPDALRSVRDTTETQVSALLDCMPSTGVVDLVPVLAARVPARTLLDLLGLPHVDEQPVRRWTAGFSDGISPWAGADGEVRAGAAMAELRDHLRPALDARRRTPLADVLTALATSRDLDDDEALQQAVLLCTAGLDTTADLLASAIAAVAARPDVWQRVVVDPASEAPAVVEETLRFESPVPFVMRSLMAPREVAGVHLDGGTPLLLAVAAANRDEAVFTDPERFDPGRIARGERRHLAFGYGVHRCLGAPLARLQATVVLRALAERHPTLALAAPVRARPRLFFRGPEAVLVDLG
jgi:cytochrome P450